LQQHLIQVCVAHDYPQQEILKLLLKEYVEHCGQHIIMMLRSASKSWMWGSLFYSLKRCGFYPIESNAVVDGLHYDALFFDVKHKDLLSARSEELFNSCY